MALKRNPWRLDAKANRWKFVHKTNLIIKVHWPHRTAICWRSKISKFLLFCWLNEKSKETRTQNENENTHCVPKASLTCAFLCFSHSHSPSLPTHSSYINSVYPSTFWRKHSMVVFTFDIPYSSSMRSEREKMEYIESGLLKRDQHRNPTNWIRLLRTPHIHDSQPYSIINDIKYFTLASVSDCSCHSIFPSVPATVCASLPLKIAPESNRTST